MVKPSPLMSVNAWPRKLRHASKPALAPPDAARTARMASFGLAFYGPLQHFWYAFLDQRFPLKTHVPHFLAKVGLNQVVLGPVVISSLFAWDLILQGRRAEVPGKVRADLATTAVNGWKFWVPASAVNFYAVPLQYQVLYMSCAGLVWSTYLSYSSNK